jgi:hypothetical protein
MGYGKAFQDLAGIDSDARRFFVQAVGGVKCQAQESGVRP